jgi:glycosyltransferase involved in cell wall biosynthesis
VKISVVTTSLNHRRFIEETLESVRNQSYPDLEHMVMDGGSTDGSVSLLAGKQGLEWKHLRWSSEADGGQSDAMNQGFRRATGDAIGWLNSDDRYRPGCLAAVARAFAEHPEVDVLYGDFTLMDERGTHLRTRREIEFNPLVLLYHRVPHIPTTATFFRRRIFDEGNFLDESLHYAMDHEFYVRLALRGYRFRHLSAVLADFRLHPGSKTCSMAHKQLEERRLALQRHAPLLQRLQPGISRTLCVAGLQIAAGAARYGEKLWRGYYLPEWIEQARGSSLKEKV